MATLHLIFIVPLIPFKLFLNIWQRRTKAQNLKFGNAAISRFN